MTSPSPFSTCTSALVPPPLLFGSTTQAFGVANTTSPSPFSTSKSALVPPPIFGSTPPTWTEPAFGTDLGSGSTRSSPLFQSTASTLAQTGSSCGHIAPVFGQSNSFTISSTPSITIPSQLPKPMPTQPVFSSPASKVRRHRCDSAKSSRTRTQPRRRTLPANDAGWTPDPFNNTGLSATLITTLIKEAYVDKYVADVHPEVDEAARTSIQAKFGISPVIVKDMIEAIPAVTPSNPKVTGSIDLLDITPLPVMLNTANQPSTQQPEALEVQPLHEQSNPGLVEEETKAAGDADDTVKEQVDADSGLDELPISRLYDRISEIMNLDINQAMEHLGELEMLFGHMIAEEESSGDAIRGLLVDTGFISANYSASDHHALTEKKHKEAMNHLDAEHEQLLAELRHLQSASARLGSYGDKLMRRWMELDIEKLVVHDGLESVATDMIGLSHDIDNARSREWASHGKQRKRLSYQHEVGKSHSILAARFRKEAEQGWQRLTASWSELSNNPTA